MAAAAAPRGVVVHTSAQLQELRRREVVVLRPQPEGLAAGAVACEDVRRHGRETPEGCGSCMLAVELQLQLHVAAEMKPKWRRKSALGKTYQ